MKRKTRYFIIIFILLILFPLATAALTPPYEQEVLKATFTDDKGGTIEYYIIKTTYRTADPKAVPKLHTDAFQAVFDVDSTTLIKEFDAGGHAAAIYQGESRNYICCTTSPTASVVMVYDPDAVSQEDMIRSIRSIYE